MRGAWGDVWGREGGYVGSREMYGAGEGAQGLEGGHMGPRVMCGAGSYVWGPGVTCGADLSCRPAW